MGHKYLKDIIPYFDSEMCIPNAEIESEESKERRERFKKQREEYGFDERETWAMDFTLACWIYEHFKYYVERVPIDLTFHHFNIEILINEDPVERKEIEVNQQEAINYVLEYFEHYLTEEDVCSDRAILYYECAMRIVAKLMPAMWW